MGALHLLQRRATAHPANPHQHPYPDPHADQHADEHADTNPCLPDPNISAISLGMYHHQYACRYSYPTRIKHWIFSANFLRMAHIDPSTWNNTTQLFL
jgi:hypothetical protein